jgi:hypothetical protein
MLRLLEQTRRLASFLADRDAGMTKHGESQAAYATIQTDNRLAMPRNEDKGKL